MMSPEVCMAAHKVVITLGSPREKGNSTLLAQRAADGVREAGGEPVTFPLHTMAIRPCRGCDACQRNKDYRCVHPDDMAAVYTALREAGGLLIASPIYWFTLSAQTKLFMDRLYAFVGPSGHGLAGKRIGIVLTYGDADPFSSGAVNALRTCQDACRSIGAPIVGMVYGTANAAGEIAGNAGLMQEAFELGKALASAG
jgi:multimeric flavodoxin WrbA